MNQQPQLNINRQPQLIIGALLLLAGLVYLAAELFNFNVWSLCWPVALILIGVWMVARPRLRPGAEVTLFGDIRRYGEWQVEDMEFWTLLGDIRIDLSSAVLPPGETKIRAYGLIGDVDLRLPPGAGLSVASLAFVSDLKAGGEKRETVFVPAEYQSSGYAAAERKVRLETYFFIADIDAVQG